MRPEAIVTNRYPLERAGEAYEVADAGTSGKVCIIFE